MYADQRLASGRPEAPASPNEGEFHAYNLLLHLRDPETQREAESLPEAVFEHPLLQSSLVLRGYAQKSNNVERRGQPRNEEATMNWYTRFFRLLRSSTQTSYLQACLAENVFHEVRLGALKALSRSLIDRYAAPTAEWLTEALGFDDEHQLDEWLTAAGIREDEERSRPGAKAYRIHNRAEIIGECAPVAVLAMVTSAQNCAHKLPPARPTEDKLSKPFSAKLVEAKRGNRTTQEVVDGLEAGSGVPAKSALRPTATSFVPSTSSGTPSTQPSTTIFGKGSSAGASQPSAFGQPAKPATQATSAFSFGQPVAVAPAPVPTASAPAAGAPPAFTTPTFAAPISFRPAQPLDLGKPVSFAPKSAAAPSAASPSNKPETRFDAPVSFQPAKPVSSASGSSAFGQPLAFSDNRAAASAQAPAASAAAPPSSGQSLFNNTISFTPAPSASASTSAFSAPVSFTPARPTAAQAATFGEPLQVQPAPGAPLQQASQFPSTISSVEATSRPGPPTRVEHKPVEVLSPAQVQEQQRAQAAPSTPAPSGRPRSNTGARIDKVIEFSQAPAKKAPLPQTTVKQFLSKIGQRLLNLITEEVTKEHARTIAFEAERVGAKTLQWQNIVRLEQERMHALRDLLIDSVTQTIGRECAAEASAKAFREMRLTELALGHWLKRTAEKKEWHRIRARSLQIEERRATARAEQALSFRPSARPSKAPADIHDELVSDAYVRMVCQSNMLWLEAAWSHIIFEAFVTLFPSYKEVWPDKMDILLSYVPRSTAVLQSDAFAVWLQTVFEQTSYEIPDSEGKTLEITTFERFRKRPFPEDGKRGPEVPLLVFECGDPGGNSTWEEARTRLDAIHASLERRAKYSRTRMVPKLLVICWLSNRPDLYHTVLSQLQIKPSKWPQLAVLALDKADITTPFVSTVSRLLNCLSWDRQPTYQESLLMLAKPMRELLTTTVNSCEAYLSSLMKQTTESHQASAAIWRQTTSLGNLMLRILCQVSTTNFPSDEPLQVPIRSCPKKGAETGSALDQLFEAAIQTVVDANGSGVPNLEMLIEELNNAAACRFLFPLSQVIDELFTGAINLLESEWSGRKPDSDDEMKANLAMFSSMCDRVADGAAEVTAEALPKYEPIAAIPTKRRNSTSLKRSASKQSLE